MLILKYKCLKIAPEKLATTNVKAMRTNNPQ